MCENLFAVILTIFAIFHLSQQQICHFSCYPNPDENNCTKNRYINANITIRDAQNGFASFEFELKCDIKSYKIQLDHRNNKSDCGSLYSSGFVAHSEYFFNVSSYSNNTNNICKKTGTVHFQNIKTGCYKVLVLDKRRYLYNKVVFLETNYTKQELDAFETNTSHDSRYNGTELKFHIENPVLRVDPRFSLSFECDKCQHFSTFYNLIRGDDTKLILNPQDSINILNITCSYNSKNASADCIVFPFSINHYNIVITFHGNPNNCPQRKVRIVNQIKIIHIDVTPDDYVVQEPNTNLQSEKIFGITLGIASSLISFYLLVLIIKLIRKNTIKFEQNVNVSTCDEKTEAKPCKNLLLLYARNADNVMNTLSSFRNIFKHLKIHVYDIYDPEKLKEINANNHSWILNLTNCDDIKIIIFLTPAGEYLSSLPKMQESVDALYLFAIKHLLSKISSDHDFNKNIFVAYFENDQNKYADYEIFSPNLRFSVPGNIQALLQRILNDENISFTNKMNNEYNKFLENYKKQLSL